MRIDKYIVKKLIERAYGHIIRVEDDLVTKVNSSSVAMNIAIVALAMIIYVRVFGEDEQ
jgi:hypothetical protein